MFRLMEASLLSPHRNHHAVDTGRESEEAA